MQVSDVLIAFGAAVLALAGGLTGGYCSTRKYWGVCFGISFCALLAFVLFHRFPSLYDAVPYASFFKGRSVFFAFSVLIPLVFGLLIPRLAARRQRRMVWVLAAVATGYFGILPFAETAWVRPRLSRLETWREDGVCLQTTDFTCGAAAAVTALARLGVEAEESALAIASFTTPSRGTSDAQLANAIESLFADQGVVCRVVRFSSVAQMRDCCPVIATVRHTFMVDHYVTVLSVEDAMVVVGDPLRGLERLSFAEFGTKWRRGGIVVRREPAKTDSACCGVSGNGLCCASSARP